ncbi:MAG: hypothetical protein ACI89J_000697 [Hyphomicrobiaceae bacterium]|jgi:hypothetical protein
MDAFLYPFSASISASFCPSTNILVVNYRPIPNMRLTSQPIAWSASMKKIDASVTMISTAIVVTQVSFRVGQVTLATSWRTSCTNLNGFTLAKPFVSNPCDSAINRQRGEQAPSKSTHNPAHLQYRRHAAD